MASGVLFFLFAGSICLIGNFLECTEADISVQELFAERRCFSAASKPSTLVHWETCAVNVDNVLSTLSHTMFMSLDCPFCLSACSRGNTQV